MINKREIIKDVAEIYNVSYLEVFAGRRFDKQVQARTCMFLVFRYMGYSLNQIARIFRMDRSTIYHGLKKVENDEEVKRIAQKVFHRYSKDFYSENEFEEVLSEKILLLLNVGKSKDEIAEILNISVDDISRRNIKFKEVPNYKNGKIKKVYFIE